MKAFKNLSFVIGFSFIALILGGSLVYGWVCGDAIPVVPLKFGEEGAIKPPYGPMDHLPFGTNALGQSMFLVMVVGAKFTLGIAFLVAFLRFVLSAFIGTVMTLYVPKFTAWIRPFLQTFYYYPITLLAFMMLYWVLFEDGLVGGEFSYSFSARVLIELAVLTLAAFPISTLIVSNEVKDIMKQEFMESVQVLGGNRRHILRKHLLPFLKPRFVILFLREAIQVLILLSHLGILGIFFGGGALMEDLFGNSAMASLSNEWSGLIGRDFKYLFTTYTWIPFMPILFLTLSIIALKLMVEGYQEAYGGVGEKRKDVPVAEDTRLNGKGDFEQIDRKIG